GCLGSERMPLRLKLLIAVIVLVLAGLATSNVVTYASLRSSLVKKVDQQLTSAEFPVVRSLSEDHPFSSPGGPPGESEFPAGTYGAVRDSTGAVVSEKTFTTYGTAPTPPEPSLPTTLPRPDAPDT